MPSNDIDIEKQPLQEEKENQNNDEVILQDSGMYGLTAHDLEELMGKYKERGNEFQDLITLETLGGPDSIICKLKTDPINGISDESNRENDFGSNKVFAEPVPSFCLYVYEALEDLMIRILIVAAFIQIVLGATLSDDPGKDWVDGLSIIVAVLVVVLVGSITNWQKENKFHELNDIQNEGTHYNVIRNGQPVPLHSDDLLVGDLINIIIGDIMPADIMLIEGNGIKMDESSLTGESNTLRKDIYVKCLNESKRKVLKPSSPFILSGTNCIEGSGLGIIVAVGEHSQKGIIKRTVDNAQESNQTPLEMKLDIIAERIGWFGMGAGAVTLVALFIRFGVNFVKDKKAYESATLLKALMDSYVQNNPQMMDNSVIKTLFGATLADPMKHVSNKILDIILLCVAIIVVAIPEGLPLAVTLSLAFSIKKLMDQNNLVRKMDACETMGGANYICTDKTGTLTKNEMNIYKVLNGKQEILLKETQDVNTGQIQNQTSHITKIRENPNTYFPNETYWNILKISIGLNLDGTIKTLSQTTPEGDMEICETKNITDNAFIDFLSRFQSPISKIRREFIHQKNCVKQFPFDSKRKRMTTLIKNESFPTGYRLFTKGGAENVQTICQNFVDPDTGETLPMDDKELILINDTIEKFNKQMLRSLYVCYKDIPKEQFNDFEKKNESSLLIDQYDLTFVGVVGIRDSLRTGVKEAVSKCKEANVNVIMVTGDNIITAVAIAKDCNILDSKFDLENMSPGDIEEDPNLINNPTLREKYLKEILKIQPTALTGSTFFSAIGGLICKTCTQDSAKCTCPKTEAEAKERAQKTGKPEEPVKVDSIQYMDKFIELTKRLKVMARSQPIHKYTLVLGLKEMNYVVAVTGDGTNDAPALSKSDIGFAMFAGTDIAKEASDIVIIDNNFSSIVVAIIYGRNIYDNIRKFLQFQLTVNFCACLLVFICACIGNETPLTPIQMLWVNLIMDSLGSLALATEPPYEALLKREPTKRNESIINGKMWKHIIFQSMVQLGLLLFLYLYAPNFIKEDDYVRLAENEIIKYCYGRMPGGIMDSQYIISGTNTQWKADYKLLPERSPFDCGKYASKQDLSMAFHEYLNANGSTAHMTIVFNVFVMYTLFNQINSRTLDDSLNIFARMFDGLFFPVVTFVEFVLQVIIIQVGNAAFHVTEKGLTVRQWCITIGFSLLTFVVSIIIKFIPIDKPIQRLLSRESSEDDTSVNDDNIREDFKIKEDEEKGYNKSKEDRGSLKSDDHDEYAKLLTEE